MPTDNRPLKRELQKLRIPDAIKRLPRDARGYPIPWFVHVDEHGTPDFRVVRPGGIALAYREKTCWLCGGRMGNNMLFAFNIGPMCAINRVNSEPPSHRGCAIFAAEACPFLANPRMRRDTKNPLPEHAQDAPGIPIDRNPGAVCIWITRHFRPFNAGNGVLFQLGDPMDVLWFCEGRTATRREVLASITSGRSILEAVAAQDGSAGLAELGQQIARLAPLLPRAEKAA